MKNYTLTLLLTAAPLFAGTPAPVAPAPQPMTEQGWTLSLEAMVLKPYQSEGQYDNNDYDFAGRGSLGYQFQDGLFVKATYFGYGTDIVDRTEYDGKYYTTQYDGRMTPTYIDLVIGQNFKPTEALKLAPYVGLRWADFKEGYTRTTNDDGDLSYDSDSLKFSGLGVVVGIDAVRALGSNFSIYGTAKQSVVFGNCDTSSTHSEYSDSTDRVAFISELGLGLQYDFCFSNVAANVRLGVEGQWWAGLSDDDSENVGLAGFVLGANFRF